MVRIVGIVGDVCKMGGVKGTFTTWSRWSWHEEMEASRHESQSGQFVRKLVAGITMPCQHDNTVVNATIIVRSMMSRKYEHGSLHTGVEYLIRSKKPILTVFRRLSNVASLVPTTEDEKAEAAQSLHLPNEAVFVLLAHLITQGFRKSRVFAAT